MRRREFDDERWREFDDERGREFDDERGREFDVPNTCDLDRSQLTLPRHRLQGLGFPRLMCIAVSFLGVLLHINISVGPLIPLFQGTLTPFYQVLQPPSLRYFNPSLRYSTSPFSGTQTLNSPLLGTPTLLIQVLQHTSPRYSNSLPPGTPNPITVVLHPLSVRSSNSPQPSTLTPLSRVL